MTPALKANFSVNTDFAETEVDERRTNLTRFPLFFEEKREFFLDGANFFEFPGGDESPFFSRRIGLNAGTPQPIIYGAKLVGQASRYDIGVLQVRTSEEEITGEAPFTLKGEDFTVARVKRRVGSQSHVGMLYTRRATHESIVEPRHTAAADVTIATPDFVKGSTLDSGAWYVYTSKPEFLDEDGERRPTGRSDSYGWHASVSQRSVQRGSVVQGGAARLQRGRRLHTAPQLPELESRDQLVAAIRGSPLAARRAAQCRRRYQPRSRQPRRSIATSGSRRWSSSSTAATASSFRSSSRPRTWTRTSRSATASSCRAGSSYDWLRYQIGYDSAEQRMFSGRVEYSFGDFWDGERQELSLDLNIRPRTGILIQLSSEFNDVDLPGGAFTTKLYQLDARTQFSPWISLSNNVQYDSESGEVGWQLRFRWIQKPGNDVFFIWTQNWQDEIGRGLRGARSTRRREDRADDPILMA